MTKRTEENPTYDYNIYRIGIQKADEFKEFLMERRFEEIPLKDSMLFEPNGFSFELMFCDKENKKGSPWVRLLSECSEYDLTQQLKIYGAALICRNTTSCFVVSYGNAHFYLGNYCDYNFGIQIAERLLNLESVKAQQNVSHGGKLSKTHIDYLSGTTLAYRGGEIPTYIKGSTINEEKWGKSINCGISAQFKWEEKPLALGKKLTSLEEALNTEATISLPRLIALDDDNDSDKINELFNLLSKAIDEYDAETSRFSFINVPSFYLVGTKIIQNDSIKFKLTCDRKHSEYDGELSIAAIQNFLSEKNLDIYTSVRNIKLSVEYGNDQWTPYKPLTEYLEFITEDNFCLRNGRWCSFNNSYIEQVFRDVSKVDLINHTDSDWGFSKEELISYAKEIGIFSNGYSQPYETYYNYKLSNLLNAVLIHPTTMPVDESANRRYKYEVCDFVADNNMYFVKIGNPSNFAYAVDQASLTLSKIQSGNGKIKLPNDNEISPQEFHLVLVCEKRKTKIEKWSDVYSINFLIHIIDLKQSLNNMNITLIVDFAYDKSIICE
jgi:uncharacterized protein (TIGR04141 family)